MPRSKVLLLALVGLTLAAPTRAPDAAHRAGTADDPATVASQPADGGDWPQFRGPERDGRSAEIGLLEAWPTEGPPERWRVALGGGFSGLAVAGETLYTMASNRSEEQLVAFDVGNGERRWTVTVDELRRDGQGDGPRSTPTVADGRVFALSAGGVLVAVDAASGSKIWSRDLTVTHGARPPQWGFSTSPLVDDGRVLVEVGGRDGAALVAFDPATGAERWRSLDDPPGYSAPLVATLAGVRQAIFFTGSRVVGVDPSDGRPHWSLGWRTSYGVNAAMPVLVPPDRIFISSGYGTGSALLRVARDGGDLEVETVWRNREMKNQFSSSVRVGEHLFGFDDSILECIDAGTGERMWRARGFGHGSLLSADGKLIILGENGLLALAAASPGEYREISRARIFRSRSWTAPTLARGTLYLRDERELVALRLRESPRTQSTTER